MVFNILAVRAMDDGNTDGRMFPVPAVGDIKVEPEQMDGSRVQRVPVTAVSSRLAGLNSTRKLAEARKILANAAITDQQRVVFWCEKYDKGGGWVDLGAELREPRSPWVLAP